MLYGCAHPEWGEKTDENYKLERREKWRKEGHTRITFDFHNEVFLATNPFNHTCRPYTSQRN